MKHTEQTPSQSTAHTAHAASDRFRWKPVQLVNGRAQIVQEAVSDILDNSCRGIVLNGVFGAGTSTVARAVIDEFIDTAVILHAEHLPDGGAEYPLGGLSFLIAALAQDRGVEPAPLGDPSAAFDLLARACRELRSTGAMAPILMIEDFHKMPAAAQRLVSGLLSGGLIKLVLVAAVASPSHAVGDLLPALRRGLLRAHTLSVLDGDGVRELMEQELGGIVPPLIAQWIAMLTGGIPRLVISYLDRAREDGLLVFDDGLWHFAGPVEGVSDELREVVALHLAELTESQRHALFVVVLAERIEMNQSVNGVLGEDLEALLESGLVQSRYDAHEWTLIPSCEHFAEAVRQHLPPGLAVTLGSLHESVLERGLGSVARAAWGVNTGTNVDGCDLVALAAYANDRLWADYALRTIEDLKEPEWRAAADIERLRARIKLRHFAEAGVIAGGIDVTALTPRQLRILMTCEGMLWGTGESRGSPSGWGDRWRSLAAKMTTTADLDPRDRAFFEEVESLLVLWADWAHPAPLDEDGTWRSLQSSSVPEVAMLAHVMSGRSLTRQADLNASCETWSRALLLAESEPGLLAPFMDSARIGWLWATTLSGEHVSPVSALPNTWGPEDSGPYLALAGHYYAASGVSDLMRGMSTPAHMHFRAAVACSRDDTAPHLLAMCRRALELTTLITTGQSVPRPVVQTATDPSLPDADLLPLRWSAPLFAAQLRALEGSTTDMSALLTVIDSALRDGEVVSAHFGLAQVMATGEDAFIRKLAEVSAGTSGMYQELIRRISRAILTVDVDDLVAVGLQSHAAGFVGLAGDALERALVHLSPYAPASVISTVAEASDAAFRETGRLLRRRQTGGSRRSSTLTSREKQVAELVARGMTNAQVAEELGLGRRTVEGHVYRMFDKLGISQRSEVEEALRS